MFVLRLRKREYGLYPWTRDTNCARPLTSHKSLLPGGGKTMNFGPFLLIAILLLVAWAGGFLMFHIAGALIHLLLVFAALSFIFNFITGRRTA